ncbi:MAG: DegT/DnrJ/EryC1/StrS aminotransferase family protein [Spirochaetaceae bacterium]|jgi:dTDP-4-amino-4,6-dideoxygalactose transaminase|nr:DegT/DnrJ/EryC1/StrS aminotransferase family protein [Spirochaetaceae bacterium]
METEAIPFARPSIGKEEEEAVLRVLRSGWLTTGAEALAFEEEFAAFLEGPPLPSPAPGKPPLPPLRALAVNSATSGLHLALEALGVGPGDLVLVPSYTFTSTAEVARYLGAEAVFVDLRPGTFHLDPGALERILARLSKGLPPYPQRGGCGPRGRPRALIPVHYGGLPCDMGALRDICRRYDLGIVEDAAHSFPSLIPGADLGDAAGPAAYAGTLGDAGVFSFYATKPIATGEGGMVVTRNQALADRIAVMRSHGIDRTVWNRYTDRGASWYYEVIEAGFKDNFPDLLAALGRVQLKRAPVLLERRCAIARRYDEAFGEERRFLIPPTGGGDARHLYPLRLREGGLKRDEFIRELQKRGIGVSVHFIPLHLMPYYKKRYALEPEDLPESLRAFEQVISLPIWPDMGEDRVERVIQAVKAIAG